MRGGFVEQVLRHLVDDGDLAVGDRVLGVCSGEGDRRVLREAGFVDVTLTNLEVTSDHVRGAGEHDDLSCWSRQDAQALTYDDSVFDVAFVSEALHHCRSPHRAATEMLRVACKGIVVVESRDSMVMRLAGRLGIAKEFEFNDVLLTTRRHGGVDYGPVPNAVYRWTEREFEKVVESFDPEHEHRFEYFHGVKIPHRLGRRSLALRAGRAVGALAPSQGNLFAMVAIRGPLKSYLCERNGEVVLRPDVSSPQRVKRPNRQHVRVR